MSLAHKFLYDIKVKLLTSDPILPFNVTRGILKYQPARVRVIEKVYYIGNSAQLHTHMLNILCNSAQLLCLATHTHTLSIHI